MVVYRPLISLLLASYSYAAAALTKQEYDFIVVGGGTAGLTLASRLSQKLHQYSVLVIEAGPDGREDSRVYIAGRKGSALGTSLDWNFTTTPQPNANNCVLAQNRGRVLGGSSAINLIAWDRGAPADYDAWEALENEGWNWTTMHRAMEAAEKFQLTSVDSSAETAEVGEVGLDGHIRVLLNRFSLPQQELFFPTARNLGLSQTYSFLDGDMLGYMRHTANVDGRNYRRSYSPSYLSSAGPRLHLMLNTTVSKLNLDEGHCVTGVTLLNGEVISARKEVIVSAGTIQSPQLLELSGIGNRGILEGAGVKPIVNLPSVGENLQDHIRITTAYQLKDSYTSADSLRLNATFAADQLAKWYRNETGFYDETGLAYIYTTWDKVVSNASYLLALAEQSADPSNAVDQTKLANLLQSGSKVPQVEVIFSDAYVGVKGYPNATSPLYGKQFIGFIAAVQHPFSRGSSHINTSDPLAHPLFNPNYLGRAYDLHAIKEAAKYTRKIAMTLPLRDVWVDEYEPGFETVQPDAEWEEYARNNVLSIWHPIGTCAMLPREAGGVVNAELKVYGVSNLRIVDASVIPALVSGHIQSAVYGIAERAAVMIARQWLHK